MSRAITSHLTRLARLLALGAVAVALNGFAQGTTFTYQGRLDHGANPASGSYDLVVQIFDDLTGGAAISAPLTNTAIGVNNGLFAITLDFGAGVFTGPARWLEMSVRAHGSSSFATLAPRQPITPAPYAVSAGNAASAATAASATTAASVPASGIGAGTANINITGSATTATSAAVAGLAVSANTAITAASATTAITALTALTAGTATNLIGNVADALLSTNIARLNGPNVFSGTNTFSNVLIATNPANQVAGVFTGSGAGLTGLSAFSIAPGSITAEKLAPGAVSALGAPGGPPRNAVQVDPNGLVGIGTTTPTAGLQITTGAAITTATTLFQVQNGTRGYTQLDSAWMPAVSGNLLAISTYYGDVVTLVDMADPANPVLMSEIENGTGVFTNLSGASGLAWSGANLAVAAYYSSALTLLSATNPAIPVKLSELRNGVGGWNYLAGASSVAVASNLLAIGAENDGAVTLADISNPSAPVLRGLMLDGFNGFTNLAGVRSVALSGNLLPASTTGSRR